LCATFSKKKKKIQKDFFSFLLSSRMSVEAKNEQKKTKIKVK